MRLLTCVADMRDAFTPLTAVAARQVVDRARAVLTA